MRLSPVPAVSSATLCQRLLVERAEVHAVSRSPRRSRDRDGLHWWQCDFVDPAAVHDLIGRLKPDVVFHFGGMVTAAPDLALVAPTFHTLLASTVNLLTAVTDVGGGRVVLSASLEEPTNDAADGLVPESPYAAAKLAAGAYARMFVKLYDTPVVSLRPFMAYGPGQNPSKIIPYTILSLLHGDAPRLSSGERALDWVYVEDVVDAFLAAASRSGIEGRTLDLGWGTAVRIRDVVDRVSRLVDPSITPRYGALPTALTYAPVSPTRTPPRLRLAGVPRHHSTADWLKPSSGIGNHWKRSNGTVHESCRSETCVGNLPS